MTHRLVESVLTVEGLLEEFVPICQCLRGLADTLREYIRMPVIRFCLTLNIIMAEFYIHHFGVRDHFSLQF